MYNSERIMITRKAKAMLEKLPPELQAMILASVIAIVRVIYDKEETKWQRVLSEAFICACLTKATYHAVIALSLSPDWAVFSGGLIGFLGTYTVRGLALIVLKKEIK